MIGPDAKPVPDAVVVVTSDDFSNPPLMARTGTDGRFTVQPRRRGPHTVRVEARGLAAQTIEKAVPGVPLRVTLAKGGSIDGIVRDGATGQPEANARVEAREEATGATPLWAPGVGVVVARTDAKGLFKLEGLARGRHSITASSRTAGRATRSGVPRRLPIDVGARQKVLDVGDVVLETGAQIRGRVRDKAAAPIADATVRGFVDGLQGRGLPPLEARTEADGTFVMGGATASAYRLMVQGTGFAPLHQPVDAPSEGVELVLDAAGSIAGLVVDGAGRPVDAFNVMAQPSDGRDRFGANPRWRSFVSEDGRFTLDGVAPGTYAVEVSARDLGQQVVSDVAVAAGGVPRSRPDPAGPGRRRPRYGAGRRGQPRGGRDRGSARAGALDVLGQRHPRDGDRRRRRLPDARSARWARRS